MTFDIEQLDANSKPLPMSRCLVCGYSFDCASRPGIDQTKRPRPGDFSLCLRCGEIYVFQDDMTVRLPTVKELMELGEAEHKELTEVQTMIRKERPLDDKR